MPSSILDGGGFHPTALQLGLPLLGLSGLLAWIWVRWLGDAAPARRAVKHPPATQRIAARSSDVLGWVNALMLKDPAFTLVNLYAKATRVFELLQHGWEARDLERVRPFLSGATYQRFRIQLARMQAQRPHDAIRGAQLLEVRLTGLDQSEWFDTVQLCIRAQVPADVDAQAAAAGTEGEPETFIEVWSFVRRSQARTRIGQDLFEGRCPNCGALYDGGPVNACGYCKAIVNSGNFDWTLSEITQGREQVFEYAMADGLLRVRERDPALNLEVLEDRLSLLFWRWIEAQERGEPAPLAPVSTQPFLDAMGAKLQRMKTRGLRKVFLDCAVVGVHVRLFREEDGFEQAHVELRWRARMGVGPQEGSPAEFAVVPQRWMFVAIRKVGAQTRTETGLATDRCGRCAAPLTELGAATCAYCGAVFAAALHDWVLSSAQTFEAWNASEARHFRDVEARQDTYRAADVIIDPGERQRLLVMMAAIASADGHLDDNERKLLELCADRWLVPWQSVEAALKAGPEIFDGLLPRVGSPEAVVFVETLIKMARIDGQVDPQELQIVEAVAVRLKLGAELRDMLRRSEPAGAASST